MGTKAFPGDNTPAHKGTVLAGRLPHGPPGSGRGAGAGLGAPAQPRPDSQLSQTLTRALELVPNLCEPPFPYCEVGGPCAPLWVWVISELGAGQYRLGCSSGVLTCVHHSCRCEPPYPHR